MLRLHALCCLLAVVGCATASDDPDDLDAETGTVQTLGKADAASYLGLYRARATSLHAGDVPSLELRASAVYVRARCYGTACNELLPETDTFDIYTSTGGKHYVRFWSETIAHDAIGNLVSTPVIADVYEIKKTATTIKLRKSYTTRWLTLYNATAAHLCTATGGAWAASACTCAVGDEFVAGAGGCIADIGADESACDASNGMWTDDDATPIGSYCVCGLDRHVDDAGSCTNN